MKAEMQLNQSILNKNRYEENNQLFADIDLVSHQLDA